MSRKNIFAIIGSASENSSNLKLVRLFAEQNPELEVIVFEGLRQLPHFSPTLSIEDTPSEVLQFRQSIDDADAILISTPEYVFSVPSGLKNAIEWCVSTTVFSGKPAGLITGSAHGQKGHEELQLIMKTVDAKFTEETCLLIQGIKGKINEDGRITDSKTSEEFERFCKAFGELVNSSANSETVNI